VTRRSTAAWAALAVAGLLAACTEGGTEPDEPSANVSTRSTAPTAGAGPAVTAQATTAAPEPACEVDLPAAWQTALEEGAVQSQDGGEVTLHRVLADGTRVLRLGPNGARSALVWESPSGEQRTIQQIGEIDWWARVGGVSSDGRYVAWSLVQWPDTEDETTRVFVWDSANEGPPQQLSEGAVVGAPVVVGGAVVWVQAGQEPLDLSGLHAFDLTSGTARVLAAGYLGEPRALGDSVVAVDQPPEGTTGPEPRVVAIRPEDTDPAVSPEGAPTGDDTTATTGGPLGAPAGGSARETEEQAELGGLPPALTEPGERFGALAAGGELVAWVTEGGDELLVWWPGAEEPWAAVELPRGAEVTDLEVADGVVAWTLADGGRWVLDPEEGGYARLTEGTGALRSLGEQLLLSPEADSGLPPVVVDPTRLDPLTGCGTGS
jgi:hypothetical protein